MEQIQKTEQIFQKIPAIMKDIEAVGKNKKNSGQGYMFRGIDDMYNALHDVLAKHEVFYTTKVLEKNVGTFKNSKGSDVVHALMDMEITFFAPDGSHVSNVVIGEAMDFGDKACGKAQSYGLKVALMQIFCIPTEEKLDTEYENHQVSAEKKQVSQNKPAQQAQATKQGKATGQQENASQQPSITLKDALQQIADAKTTDEVKAIYKNLPQFHTQPTFKEEATKKGTALKGKESTHAS